MQTYRLERGLAIFKVQCAKEQSRLALPVPLCPTPRQQFPLRLEGIAQATSESCVEGRQEDCDVVVSWGAGELAVGDIVEFEASGGRELLGEAGYEAVFGGGRDWGDEAEERQQCCY